MVRKVNMDHRKSKRHEIHVTTNLICENTPHPAKVIDISTGGAKVMLASSSLQKDDKVRIDLPFLHELDAQVIWVQDNRCGIRFKDDQDRLNEFLYNLAIYGLNP